MYWFFNTTTWRGFRWEKLLSVGAAVKRCRRIFGAVHADQPTTGDHSIFSSGGEESYIVVVFEQGVFLKPSCYRLASFRLASTIGFIEFPVWATRTTGVSYVWQRRGLCSRAPLDFLRYSRSGGVTVANGNVPPGFVSPDDPVLEEFLFGYAESEEDAFEMSSCRKSKITLREKYGRMKHLPEFLTHADRTAPQD